MGDLRDRLRQVVAGFSQVAGSVCRGALVQIWGPQLDDDGGIELRTKGEPWNVEGAENALLHHFRQQSKAHGFPCEAGLRPETMGCVGRVFRSGEAEFYQDVQALPPGTYLRAAAAAGCGVSASLLVPLFDTAGRGAGAAAWAGGVAANAVNAVADRPFAVLELAVAQANPYGALGLYMWMRDRLSMLGLYVPQHIARTYDMAGRAPERREGTSERGGARLSSSAEPDLRSCGGAETSPMQGPSADGIRLCLGLSLEAAAARLGCRPTALIRACRRHCVACPRWVRPTCSVSALTHRRGTPGRPANAGDFVPRRLHTPPRAAGGHAGRARA
ncbi:hypothetical protein WJX81_005175 [Elliptochloris bilobata]|uniref:Uncharacterized protein n=1 Tax=Elliptochloris bilobata TaxID=381761 RepID=A0AAW1R2T4_9CHLO